MDYGELVGAVIERKFPILPRPNWGQDAAFLGFMFDALVKENQQLQEAVDDLWSCMDRQQIDKLQPETQIEARRIHNSIWH